MSAHAYTEDQLVEQPAMRLFADLDWSVAQSHPHPSSAPSPQPSPSGGGSEETRAWIDESGLFGRENKGEVVLVPRLRAALEKLNPALPPEAIAAAVDELTRDRSAMGLPAANREVYRLLKDGIAVSVVDPEAPPSSSAPSPQPSPRGRGSAGTKPSALPLGVRSGGEGRGGQRTVRVRVIDWENPAANDFLLVSQFSVTGALYTCRPDLVGFVNGLPLVAIELKKPGVPARMAFDENLTSYKHPQNGIPALFVFNALLIASNGTDSRVGSLTADWERFFEWKRIEREDEPRRVSLEVMIRGTCAKARLLDLAENFTLFSEHKAGLAKIIGQNHQVLGVNAAIASLHRIRPDLANPATLAPSPSPTGRGESPNYRGGLQFSGLVDRARQLRQQQTPAEDIVWELLRDRRFEGLKFRRQHQIGNYIADFCCAEHKLDVEIDGDVHQSQEVAAKDARRDAYLRSLGFTVLRFKNHFVLEQPEEFLRQIRSSVQPPSTSGTGAMSAGKTTNSNLPSTSGRGAGGEGKTTSSNGIGVFWQTQGSGKSFSMVFFAQKILRRIPGNWTFVIVTDRIELDDQIAKTFKGCGAVSEAESKICHADSSAHLRELLRGNHRYVFTLIHKFQPERLRAETPSPRPSPTGRGSPEGSGEGNESIMPVLCDRQDVIVLTDEAHRSQYDTLAVNMRAALPKALFLAFTGTPLIAGEERTKEVFGDYVSIYDYQQSVEDGATVPLFYENRTPELKLTNPRLNEDIYDIIEEAALDEAQEDRLARVLGRQYHIITRDDRLDKVAEDIVRHFLGRGFQGKAMVVSIDKATALRMHDKVKHYWRLEQDRVEKEIQKLDSRKTRTEDDRARLKELKDRLDLLVGTDMALIVSPGQNEVEQMKALGLDIVPHRKRMVESKPGLDEKFKDTKDPLRLVFVCAMWLTGFDAPSCSTVYIDKPMRNHTLMQTIARANRVFPGKHSGLIVDYANVFASLERALAIYGAGKGGKTPVRDKIQLVEDLRRAVTAATTFCAAQGVSLGMIHGAETRMQRLELLTQAVESLISPDALRKEFLSHERIVRTLYDAVKPDKAVIEFSAEVDCLCNIGDAIRAKLAPGVPDISGVMSTIDALLDRSIEGVHIAQSDSLLLDLSKIDFEALAEKFKTSKTRHIDLETLKAAIQAMLDRLIRFNSTRADFQEQFEAMIAAYNNGSRNIDELFNELLQFSRALTEEETRHVRENLSEEELTVFDILTRPGPELTTAERNEVKKVASHLLTRLKETRGIDWRGTVQSRAKVKETIEEELDALPGSYTRPIFAEKCSKVFEHLFQKQHGAESGHHSRIA